MSINRVVITANLGADPELRKTQSGTSVLNMRVAVNDRRKNNATGEWEDYCNWVDVVVFGNRADGLAGMLHKGSKIGVEGKLRWSEWMKDGNRRSKIDVVADNVEILSPKNTSGNSGYSDRHSQARQDQAEYVQATYFDDDDLPW